MNATLEKAIRLLREVSRDDSDFQDLSPETVADNLEMYWSEDNSRPGDGEFLKELRAL